VNIDDLEKVLDEAKTLIEKSLERLTEAEKMIEKWK
jgi:predicted transcriptional regulator